MTSVVYHYTSLDGFLGIFNSKKMRFSSIKYLNDMHEYYHGMELAKEFLEAEYKENRFVMSALRNISEPEQNFFVASFTEKGDLLSQWRGYCPKTGGVSIGFDFDKLEGVVLSVGQSDAAFEKCKYGKEFTKTLSTKIERKIGTLVRAHLGKLAAYQSKAGSSIDTDPVARKELIEIAEEGVSKINNGIVNFLRRECIFSKDVAFREEKEIRALLKIKNSQEIQFKSSGSYISPFVELDMSEKFSEIIKSITIGPGPNQKRCEYSIKHFLEVKEMNNVHVRLSRTPLNSW